MNGLGKFYYSTGAIYEGCFLNNKKHGIGQLTLRNGKVYTGEFINNELVDHGKTVNEFGCLTLLSERIL